MDIKIKYHDPHMPRVEQKIGSDWIDLRVVGVKGRPWIYNTKDLDDYGLCANNKKAMLDSEYVIYHEGDMLMLNLGVSISVPKGFECHVVPRSSTFKSWGLMQTNSLGVIDNAYCGNDDVWHMPVVAMRCGAISRYSRVCQFRVVESMPKINFNIVEDMNCDSRGGFGSTGVE